MARDYFFAFGSGNPATNASLTPTFITFANSAGTTFTAPSISEKPPGSGLYTVNYGATQTMAFIMDGATSGLATTDRYISGVFDPYDQFGVTLNGTYAFGATNFALNTTAVNQGNTLFALGTLDLAQGTTNFAVNTLAFAQGGTLFSLESTGNTALFGLAITLIAQGVTIVAMGNTLAGMGVSLSGLAGILGTTASPIGTSSVDPSDIMGYLRRLREYNEGNRIYTKATGLLDFYSRGGATLLIEKTISDSSSQTTKT